MAKLIQLKDKDGYVYPIIKNIFKSVVINKKITINPNSRVDLNFGDIEIPSDYIIFSWNIWATNWRNVVRLTVNRNGNNFYGFVESLYSYDPIEVDIYFQIIFMRDS